MAWLPEVQVGGIPAGEHGKPFIDIGEKGAFMRIHMRCTGKNTVDMTGRSEDRRTGRKNGKNPVPVKRGGGEKKRIVSGMFTGRRLSGEKGRRRNLHKAAVKPGTLKKPVCTPERQNRAIADIGVSLRKKAGS